MPFSGPWTVGEVMAARISKEVRNGKFVGSGAASPVPMAGILLALETAAPNATYLEYGGTSVFPNDLTGKERFDLAQRGKLDLFFLGGAQIDGEANLNLTVIGEHDTPDLRLPGAAGSGMLYFMTKRVILFRMEHTKRVLVPKVDFITTPGTSTERVHRPGGPNMLITNLCVMRFLKEEKCFELESVHPGVTVQEVMDNTGFTFRIPAHVPETATPTPDELHVLRTSVKQKLTGAYPQFVREGGIGAA